MFNRIVPEINVTDLVKKCHWKLKISTIICWLNGHLISTSCNWSSALQNIHPRDVLACVRAKSRCTCRKIGDEFKTPLESLIFPSAFFIQGISVFSSVVALHTGLMKAGKSWKKVMSCSYVAVTEEFKTVAGLLDVWSNVSHSGNAPPPPQTLALMLLVWSWIFYVIEK